MIVPSGVRPAAARTVRVRSPQLLTYALSPSGVTAMAYGSAPVGASPAGWPVERSMARTRRARFSATSSVFPADEQVRAFLDREGRGDDFAPVSADPDAGYDVYLLQRSTEAKRHLQRVDFVSRVESLDTD